MIINIRGTSGSGKSTLVRRVMEQYSFKTAFKIDGRKQPIGYLLSKKGSDQRLAIIGHYETACGGCDTISLRSESFRLIREANAAGYNVLFEGLLLSEEVNYTAALHQDGMELVVVGLDKVPTELCLSSINQRRRDAEDERIAKVNHYNQELLVVGSNKKPKPIPERKGPVNPHNTVRRVGTVNRSMERLKDAGVTVHSCDREEAFALIAQELNL